MQIRLSFKTPGVLDYALAGLSEDQKQEVKDKVKKFVEYEEALYVEIDTDEGTATVLTID